MEGSVELGRTGSKVVSTVESMLELVKSRPELLEYSGRDLAYSIAHTYKAALLMQHAVR